MVDWEVSEGNPRKGEGNKVSVRCKCVSPIHNPEIGPLSEQKEQKLESQCPCGSP